VGKGGRCVRLTTYHHHVTSRNLGTLTSWNPLGTSRPVTGLIYLYLFHVVQAVWLVGSVLGESCCCVTQGGIPFEQCHFRLAVDTGHIVLSSEATHGCDICGLLIVSAPQNPRN